MSKYTSLGWQYKTTENMDKFVTKLFSSSVNSSGGIDFAYCTKLGEVYAQAYSILCSGIFGELKPHRIRELAAEVTSDVDGFVADFDITTEDLARVLDCLTDVKGNYTEQCGIYESDTAMKDVLLDLVVMELLKDENNNSAYFMHEILSFRLFITNKFATKKLSITDMLFDGPHLIHKVNQIGKQK